MWNTLSLASQIANANASGIKAPPFQETTNVLNFIAELKSEMCLLKENCNILDILIYSQKAESKSSSISSLEYKPGYTHKSLIDEN